MTQSYPECAHILISFRSGRVFGLPSAELSQVAVVTPRSETLMSFLQLCLVHLGDLARYRNQLKLAESYYKLVLCQISQVVPYEFRIRRYTGDYGCTYSYFFTSCVCWRVKKSTPVEWEKCTIFLCHFRTKAQVRGVADYSRHLIWLVKTKVFHVQQMSLMPFG